MNETSTTTTTPAPETQTQPPQYRLPPQPRGFRRLALYSKVWRSAAGDWIEGDILGAQPTELADGRECMAIMLQLSAPCTVVVFDEQAKDREEEAVPVQTISPTSSSMVAVNVSRSAGLARLLTFAEQPTYAQRVQIHAVPHVSDNGAETIRHLVFLADAPSERSKVDPVEMARLDEARRAAAEAAKTTNGAAT